MTYGITWGLAALVLLVPRVRELLGAVSLANPLVIFAVYAPTLSAITVSVVIQGRAGLRELFGRLLRWRIGLEWYAAVLLGIPAFSLCARLVNHAFTGAPVMPQFAGARVLVPSVLLAIFTDPGPLGEELGWRGYALPRLLARRSALSAALILGIIWGAWHLPAFFLPGMPQSQMSIVLFMIGTVEVSILMTWVYVHSEGNLLPMILAHLMFNLTGSGPNASLALVSTVLGLAVTTVVILIEGPQTLSRAVPDPAVYSRSQE